MVDVDGLSNPSEKHRSEEKHKETFLLLFFGAIG